MGKQRYAKQMGNAKNDHAAGIVPKFTSWAVPFGVENLLFAFDYDGTLAPLESRPELVIWKEQSRQALQKLSGMVEVAIVSGRGLGDLSRAVGEIGSKVHLIGNHGAEWRLYTGETQVFATEGWEVWREKTLSRLKELTAAHQARLEDKGFSLTVHYERSAHGWWQAQGRQKLEKLSAGILTLVGGIAAWNLVPVGGPTKGSAVRALLKKQKLVAALYLGDEATDESVFELQDLPVFGIKVGPGESAAPHRLQGPDEVGAFIQAVAVGLSASGVRRRNDRGRIGE